jgi:hypothetical protein
MPWLWTLAYGHHENRTPIYGYEPTREAAMAAFAKSWRRSGRDENARVEALDWVKKGLLAGDRGNSQRR